MPSIDWFWFIAGILVGHFLLGFLMMWLGGAFSRLTNKSGSTAGV